MTEKGIQFNLSLHGLRLEGDKVGTIVENIDPEFYEIARSFRDKQNQAFLVFCDRQKKYGTRNISAAGWDGVLTRAQDKLERLKHAPDDFGDDTTEDGCIDLSNYPLIGWMVRDGSWPQPTKAERVAALKEKMDSIKNQLEYLVLESDLG